MTSQKPKLYDIRQVKVAIELAVNKANKQAVQMKGQRH